jgi:hypothetical protein
MRKNGMKHILLALFLMLAVFFSAFAEEEVSFADITDPKATPSASPSPDGISSPSPDPLASPRIEKDGSVLITISAIGDITIGRNAQHAGVSIFDKELKKHNDDIAFVFKNIVSFLEADDMTIANFEGTLSDDYKIPSNKANNDYLFIAPTSYVQALSAGSIEAVSLENNHVRDFGDDGYSSTIRTLENAGIVWGNSVHVGYFNAQGIRIAMLAYQTFNGVYPALLEQVPKDVAQAKQDSDLVIVSFHWGDELDYKPNENQQMLGKATIDAGADLVLGHHSHRINPIEEYEGKYIVYSLGNIAFAGNAKPSDMSTFIFQARFRQKDGLITNAGFRIIPCRISSRTDYNDFTPTPFEQQIHIDNVISMLKKNGSVLVNPVASYPLDWE